MAIPQVPMQLLVDSGETSASLHIMGDVTRGGWFGKDDVDTDSLDVAEALADLPESVGEITVHINSYGGEVAEGVAIYNALRSHPARVTTVCEGFACSIASVIFMAGERRVMRPASLLMLHNASMGVWGDANEHRKAAEDLDTITELSRTAYLEHATDALTEERLRSVMDRETWVKPETALEWGLATEVEEPGDGPGPTQSARDAVMRRLTSAAYEVRLTGRQVEEITHGVFERLTTELGFVQGEPDELELPGQADCPEPEPLHASERHARLFEKLSEE